MGAPIAVPGAVCDKQHLSPVSSLPPLATVLILTRGSAGGVIRARTSPVPGSTRVNLLPKSHFYRVPILYIKHQDLFVCLSIIKYDDAYSSVDVSNSLCSNKLF